ncbi:MAG: tRNA (N6-isopentenyl adenosine(37)-C2)-methylthiotransferase MiaB [Candidatus Humimicrobiaceae bacterium]
MKAYISTFGCQMNEYDSERIAYYLKQEGYSLTDNISDAGIIIFNTCAVRENAKNKLYGHIGNLKHLKRENKSPIICVGGCSAQNLKEEILKNFPFVDIVFGTFNISELPSLIRERNKLNKSICKVHDKGFDYKLDHWARKSKFKAYIPVITGCNNFCSYCIVPYVRGREKSIEPEKIIDKAQKLVANGIVEVTLLGQNVNSYGNDLGTGVTFANLLESVSNIEGLKRIRFMTSHPKDFDGSIIKIISNRNNIANHIHLPLQAGSDKILRKMNRKYTSGDYLKIVEKIREELPDCSITTDLIVGFPGEEKKDFLQTLDLVKEIRFKRAFTFIYSEREGTKAAQMEDYVSSAEKKEWFRELVEIQNKISEEENKKMVGKNFKVLVEGISAKHNLIQGRLEDNTVVLFEGRDNLTGRIITVNIKQAKAFYLIGEIND